MIKVSNFQELEKAFKAKTTNQIICFDIVNKIWKVKEVQVKIQYSSNLHYYKVYFSKESISFVFTKTKAEALEFIIDEAKRLWFWKDIFKRWEKVLVSRDNKTFYTKIFIRTVILWHKIDYICLMDWCKDSRTKTLTVDSWDYIKKYEKKHENKNQTKEHDFNLDI